MAGPCLRCDRRRVRGALSLEPGTVKRNRARRYELEGVICSAGFAPGDRFVIGHWGRSPIGPMTDVMWAQPDGRRVLLAPRRDIADFVATVYSFDSVELVPVEVEFDGRRLDLTAGDVLLTMRAGPGWRLPFGRLRPAWFTRWVEGAVAWPLMGVRTFGVGPTGIHQWYRAHEYRPLVEARAVVAGTHLGPMQPFDTPVAFGFSGPPRRPSMVRLQSVLVDRSDRLAAVLGRGVP